MELMRRVRDVVAALLLAVCPAHAASVNFISLNALHYGWSPNATKNTRIVAELRRAPNFQAVFLQEVMNGADLSAINPYPSAVLCHSGLLGHSTYKETYAILVSTPGFATMPQCSGYPDPGNRFSRPPQGALITTTTGAKDIWLIDYHAVFGKSITARKLEVSTMTAAGHWFRSQRRATQIAAGDWNLRGDILPMSAFPGFDVVRPTATFTSLKRNGGWSQAYDHFVLFDGAISTVSYNGVGAAACVVRDPIVGRPTWRNTVSDHVPVYCSFNY